MLHKPTDTDFSASVARMRYAGCELLALGTIVRDSVQIIGSVRKAGWNVNMLGQAASYDDAVAQVPGGTTEGFYSMTPMLFSAEGAESPDVKVFADAYHKEYGKNPNFAAQLDLTGAQLVVQGLKNAGRDLTPDSYVAGMEAIKNYHDIFGSPMIAFSTTKHQGSNQSFLSVVKGGHWEAAQAEPLGY